ncbi:hypothetical protein N658DRAFT_549764 [Parathielavia hyrcaniae]|uniref:BHLH domain-containing protein n=1 Tax=Parathielavia hyrcaniae TaxID=113614 RepID=A0AAN6Q467_9PEZI|nr:hypothetical protein N658DRAFT_549764 [Parathielavia hyrcaniae]
MDSDPLKNLEFFSIPNNQTINPVDQPYFARSTTQPPSIWDSAEQAPGLAFSSQPSPLARLPIMSPDLSSTPRPPSQGLQSRRILPARGPRAKEGHERKRSRLSLDATTPLDSVDYWLNFDTDDNLASIPEASEPSKLAMDGSGKDSRTNRRINTARAPSVTKPDENADDSALGNALSDDDGFSSFDLTDQLSRIDTAPPEQVPPREGLYSTPLSWERPQPGLRADSLMGLHNAYLNEAEQRRLIAIAMNPGPSMGGLGSNINLGFGGMAPGMSMTFETGRESTGTSQDPKPVSPPQPSEVPRRPAPSDAPKKEGDSNVKSDEKPKIGDRTSHNDIERKYRTNLKDKIAELKNAVPELRTTPETGDEEDAAPSSRAAKVSKGTVLTKATEYIHLLERRNKQIVQEHRDLSRRLQAFEQLLNATARQSYAMPTYSRTLFDPRGFC